MLFWHEYKPKPSRIKPNETVPHRIITDLTLPGRYLKVPSRPLAATSDIQPLPPSRRPRATPRSTSTTPEPNHIKALLIYISSPTPAYPASQHLPPPKLMAEEAEGLNPAIHTTTPDKSQKLRRYARRSKPRRRPRKWRWLSAMTGIIFLVGFLTCRPPSRGYYYRQWCCQELQLAWACLSDWIHTASSIVLECIKDTLLPWISDGWRVFQQLLEHGWACLSDWIHVASSILSKCVQETLLLCISHGWRVFQDRCWEYAPDLLYCEWPAILGLGFTTVLGVAVFLIWSKRQRQSTSASLAHVTLIEQLGEQGSRTEPALKTPIDKAKVRETWIWLVGKILLGTAVLGVTCALPFQILDVETFWECCNRAR